MSDDRRPEPPILSDFHKKTRQHVVPDWIVEHLKEYAEDPEKAHLWDARAFGGSEHTPTLLLTTRGRKTGRLLTTPLIYGADDGHYIVVGSKGGAPQNPGWMFNLEADPNVEVQVVRDRFAAVARVASGEERERLWEMMAAIYPPYRDYQARTPREIPVVVLTRR
ncbi:nitroreductase family deazaflavin-dependent oxidoreductase [Panacagrimonas sp.]|uniref:nitroreductase family deazaflavin-dependent oxidoreductase n=1 Tax=Panacagrimonas sp. TaxID=2480088 RepID=UPI003B52134D